MQIKEFSLDDSFLVRTSGTSDGTQDKYFKDNLWFKIDRYGGEGIAEAVSSLILKESGMASSLFVEYEPCLINGKQGCVCKNFLDDGEDFITFYRLYKNVTGHDLAGICAKMDYDDAIEYVLDFIKTQTNLDMHEYLANIFELDRIILNEDRHFNNLGVIFNGTEFSIAPIFDNGKSFLIGNNKASESSTTQEKIKTAYAKSFSPSFEMNARYLKKYRTFSPKKSCIDLIKDCVPEEIIGILTERLK